MQRLLQLGVTLLCVASQSLLFLFSSWPLPAKRFWQYTPLTQQPVEELKKQITEKWLTAGCSIPKVFIIHRRETSGNTSLASVATSCSWVFIWSAACCTSAALASSAACFSFSSRSASSFARFLSSSSPRALRVCSSSSARAETRMWAELAFRVCRCSRTFPGFLRLLFDLPQPLDQLVLLELYPLLLLLGVLALLLLVLQLCSGRAERNRPFLNRTGHLMLILWYLSICFWCFSSLAWAFICCTSMVSGFLLLMYSSWFPMHKARMRLLIRNRGA